MKKIRQLIDVCWDLAEQNKIDGDLLPCLDDCEEELRLAQIKSKKLLFGLIEMNKNLYNILYTVLCLIILSLLVCGQAIFITYIFEPESGGYGYIFGVITAGLILYFVASKLLSKNNYI